MGDRGHEHGRDQWAPAGVDKDPGVLRPVLAVAAYGLPGAAPLPETSLDADSWNAFVGQVRAHRLTGLMARAVLDGAFPVNVRQHHEAMTVYWEALAYVRLLEQRLLDIADLFDEGGFDYRVLKGPALARLVYRDKTMRLFGDLDLLVPAAQFEDAIEVLLAGAECTWPFRDWGSTSEFGKGTNMYTRTRESIDLHRRLDHGPFGQLVAPEELFSTVDYFAIGQRTLPALAPEERFVHACLHAQLGNSPPRVLSLRDVAQCVTAVGLWWPRVEELCRRWRVGSVVGSACASARRLLGVRLPAEAHRLAEQQPSRRDQRLMRAYETARHDCTAMPLATLTGIPNITAKMRFLRLLLLPERQYMLKRYPNHWTRWRRVGPALAASARATARRMVNSERQSGVLTRGQARKHPI